MSNALGLYTPDVGFQDCKRPDGIVTDVLDWPYSLILAGPWFGFAHLGFRKVREDAVGFGFGFEREAREGQKGKV